MATSSAFTVSAKAGNYTISATTPGVTKATFAEANTAFTTAPTACGTFRFANVGLGGTGYYTPANGSKLTFSGSTITYDPGTSTLTVTLGAMSTAGTENKVASSIVQLNLPTGTLDTGDNALTGYTYATGSIPQF